MKDRCYCGVGMPTWGASAVQVAISLQILCLVVNYTVIHAHTICVLEVLVCFLYKHI